jgi:hypothetical protein
MKYPRRSYLHRNPRSRREIRHTGAVHIAFHVDKNTTLESSSHLTAPAHKSPRGMLKKLRRVLDEAERQLAGVEKKRKK